MTTTETAPAPVRRRTAERPRSPLQAEAARANGARSQGPVTAEGRVRSSMNALCHGMFAARYVVLPGESEDEFREYRDSVAADLGADGYGEGMLAHTITTSMVREQRLDDVERALWLEHGARPTGPLGSEEGIRALDLVTRLQARNQTMQVRARTELRRRRAERDALKEEHMAKLQESLLDARWTYENRIRQLEAELREVTARAEKLSAAAEASPVPDRRNEPTSAESPDGSVVWDEGDDPPADRPGEASVVPPISRTIAKLMRVPDPEEMRREPAQPALVNRSRSA